MIRFLLIAIFISSLHSNDGVSEPLEKVSLQLHWKYQFEFAGFIAAKEKGFYEDVGLDVELKEYVSEMDVQEEILSGRSEYGVYNSSSLVNYLKGEPLKLIASFFKRAALVLVTTPQIKSPKNLVGKKIMATTKEDFILNYKPYFDFYNVNVDDVTLVPHTYGVEEFINGEVSAMTAFISDGVLKLQDRDVKYNILDPSDNNLFVLQLELLTSKNEAKRNSKRVQAFKEASIKGWEYALKHKDEIVNVIYDKYSKKISKRNLKLEAMGVEKLILPYTYDIGSIDKNFLNKQINYFKDYYRVGKNVKLKNFIFESAPNSLELKLTKEELEYLSSNKTLSVCVHPNIYPIDGYVEDRQTGIMGDLYAEMAEKLNVDFKAINVDSYKDLHSKVHNKSCQVVSIVPSDTQRFPLLNLTKPFFKTHFALISAIDKSYAQDLSAFSDKKLMVQFEGHKEKVLKLYPDLDIEVEPNLNVMMKRVINNEVFAVIAANEVADYLIDKYGYGKLKINGFLGRENVIEGSVGVQKEERILFSIMEKTLQSISSQKIDNIVKSWRLTRYHNVTNYNFMFKILVIVAIIMSIMIYYQRKLKISNAKLAQTIDELTQKDKILTFQSKQAVMGEMMSMIAHQWRQPLSTITLQISNLQIDRMVGKEIKEEDIDKTLLDISDRIIYLSETIDDFQTYFHPNKEKTEIGIRELFEKAFALNKARISTSQIRVNLNIHQDIPLKIYMNELIQVLLNILNNAIDAFETTDRENKYVNISANEDKEYVYIHIKDNAGGIEEQYLERLFEPYFSTKGKNGTGLGLYMSNMIVEKQFQGGISVQTRHDTSIFTVKILKNI